MEKTRKGRSKTLVMRASLLRKAWLNITLFLLAGAMIGLGVYFSSQAHWSKRADINWYNQGVSNYNLPAELLPATDDRPSEYPIVRAAAYFQQAALESKDDSLRSLTLYNLGTLMGKDALTAISGGTPFFGAVDALSHLAEAIRIDPDNEDAKYNLELLEEVLATATQEQWLSDILLWQAYVPSPGFFLGEVDKGF